MDLNNGSIIDQLDLVINILKGREWDENAKKWMLKQPRLAEVIDIVLKEEGLHYTTAMKMFKDFLIQYYNMFNGDVIIGGDHISVDATWINSYLSMCDYEPLHTIFGEVKHPVDIHSYHQGCSRKTHRYVRE